MRRILCMVLTMLMLLEPINIFADVQEINTESSVECTITANIEDDSEFTVTLPKSIVLQPDEMVKEYTYSIDADIRNEICITVEPDTNVEIVNGSKVVNADILQNKTTFYKNDLLNVYNGTGTLTLEKELTMGDWAGSFMFTIASKSIQVRVNAKDENGSNLNASASTIVGEERDELLESLKNSGYINDVSEVDALINVESDDFDGLAETTFDVSNIAKEGDKVVILHFDETKQEWEYIGIEIVDDEGKISGDFTSYSPVAFVKVDSEGNLIPVETLEPGLYNAEGTKLASWDELEDDYNLDITADYSLSDTGESNMLASILGQSEFEDTIKIVVPNGVTRIGDCAFAMCENLTEIVVPSSVKEVGGYAFAGCMSLDCLKLPSNVDTVGYLSFYFVPYVVYNGLLDISYTGMSRLNDLYFTELTSEDVDRLGVVDANGVATIPEYIERDGTTYAVRSISGRCFENNINLVEVIISNNIMMVNASAFWCCSNLETVKFEYNDSHLMSLLGSAFFKCTSLETIYLPKTLTFIDEGVFDDCTSLTTVYYEGSEDDWNAISINDYHNDYLMNSNKIYNSTMN